MMRMLRRICANRQIMIVVMISAFLVMSFGTGAAVAQDALLEEVHQLVTRQQGYVSWKSPGPPIDVKSSVGQLEGKEVLFIANGLNYPFVQNVLRGLQESLGLANMEVIGVDGAGQVAKAAQLMEQGIARNVDVIIIESFPAEQLTAPIQACQKAGIPIIEQFGRDPQLPPPELGISAVVSYSYSGSGREMADLVVADSGGKANVVFFDVPEIGVSQLVREGFVEEMQRLCPNAQIKVVDTLMAQWSTTLANLTASVIRSDPGVNYLVPAYDSMIALMKPAIYAIHAQDRVKIVSSNASYPAMQDLKKGELLIGDVGGPQHWIGWATADQIYRILLGYEPVADEFIPNRTFTRSNIEEIDLDAEESTWYGPLDFRSRYTQLWGFE